MNLVSIIIAVYNEEKTLQQLLDKIKILKKQINTNLEIIIINDGSTDSTKKIIDNNSEFFNHIITNNNNYGKGYSIIKGLEKSIGDYIFFQDADLEYNPKDLKIFIESSKKFNCDIVMGSRFIAHNRSVLHFWHMLGNKLITFIFNILNNTTFTDIYCCYCFFKKDLINTSKLKSRGWGQQAEILSQIVKKSKKNYEVGVEYNARNYSDGKKIRYYHVFEVIYWILVGKFFRN